MSFHLTRRRGSKAARFPNRIREYRIRAGLTQDALAAAIGRSRSVISLWERGYSLPSVVDLFKLARALATLTESLYIGLYQLHRSDAVEANPAAA